MFSRKGAKALSFVRHCFIYFFWTQIDSDFRRFIDLIIFEKGLENYQIYSQALRANQLLVFLRLPHLAAA
ncbi:hypothetical protein D1AOALGA4SA_11019 [Olavius algarvensis Delta 1 endosymbiont]|nr:hypothetical protein D1AOALGA4SA_11019 [Olavius algarvensis Delta 1 endosymbiont]